MAYRRQRSNGSWEFQIKRAILPKPITLTFDTEAEGDTYCKQLEKLLDAGIVPEEFRSKSEKSIKTIGQAIDAYIATVHITDDDELLLGKLNRSLNSKSLADVNYRWAEQWIKELHAMGYAPSSTRKRVGALARCFDWVLKRSDTMLAINPLRQLPKGYATVRGGAQDQERDRRLQPGEEEKIMAILRREKPKGRQRPLALKYHQDFILFFHLALETAMRMREMYTLIRDQINFEQRTIFLTKTKNGDNRQVPMSSIILPLLKQHLESKDDDNVFAFWDGKTDPYSLKNFTTRLSAQWKRIFSAAECDDLHLHDLRHEATSRLYERTKFTDIQISRITGHKNLQMLRRYSNLRGSTMAEEMW